MSDREPPTRIARERFDRIVRDLKNRGMAHATLGANLKHKEWAQAGAAKFAKFLKWFPITKQSRVIEYGCGTFRIGRHFIDYLDTGCYFGLDVTEGLIDIGKSLLGDDEIARKAPQFAVIDEAGLARAEAFNADFVFSWAVAFHVHPDENGFYMRALARLTHKSGAILFFNTKIADPAFQYGPSGFARPAEVYFDGLAPLKLAEMHKLKDETDDDKSAGAKSAVMEFRRD